MRENRVCKERPKILKGGGIKTVNDKPEKKEQYLTGVYRQL